MNDEYELLIEKENIWSEMYRQLLEQNGIRYIMKPVNGVGLSMKVGCQYFVRIYVASSEKK